MPPDERARSCSKASSHCPGKRRDETGFLPQPFRPAKKTWMPAPSAGMTDERERPAMTRRMGGLPLAAAREAQHASISQRRSHFTPAQRSSTRATTCPKGKPPGGDPAAPVRRRSCRGAGSATAGARLLYVVTTGAVRQSVPCPSCPYRCGAGPTRGASSPRDRGSRPAPLRPSD